MKTKALKSLMLVAAAIVLVVASVLGTMAYLTSSSAVSNVFTVGNVKLQMFESPVNSKGQVVNKDGTFTDLNGVTYNAAGEVVTRNPEAVPGKTNDTNSYHLMPGTSYVKDPTIFIDATSDESYLFIRLRNDLKTIEKQGDPQNPTIVEQLRKNGWLEITRADTNVDAVFVYVGQDLTERVATAMGTISKDGLTESQYTAKLLTVLTDIKAKVVGGTGAQQQIKVFDQFALANEIDGLERFGGARVAIVAYAIQINGDISSTGVGTQATYMKAWDYIKQELPFVD